MILERTELWCERRSWRGGKKEGSTCVVSLTRERRLVPLASLLLIYSLLHFFFTLLFFTYFRRNYSLSPYTHKHPLLLKTMFLFSISYFAYLLSKVLLLRNYSFGECHLCFSKCPQKVTPDHPTLTHLSFFPNSGHVH